VINLHGCAAQGGRDGGVLMDHLAAQAARDKRMKKVMADPRLNA
jgi:uncharacterized protein YbaA (DUF1428 family)